MIVAAVYAAMAGALALVGKRRAGTPPIPEEAVDSVKEDVEWTKTKAEQARM